MAAAIFSPGGQRCGIGSKNSGSAAAAAAGQPLDLTARMKEEKGKGKTKLHFGPFYSMNEPVVVASCQSLR